MSPAYNEFKAEILKGTVDLVNHNVKCALLDGSHSFNADESGWSSISANEVVGTGYTAGGQSLTNRSVTQDNTNDKGVFDADDLVWSNSTLSARYAVIYDDTVTNPADMLILCVDFGQELSSNNGAFTIQWDTDGVLAVG